MSPYEPEIRKIGGLTAEEIIAMDDRVEHKMRTYMESVVAPLREDNANIKYALEDIAGNPSKNKEGLIRAMFRELSTKMDSIKEIQTGQHEDQTRQLTKQDANFAEFRKEQNVRHEANQSIVPRVAHIEEWILRDEKAKENYHTLYELLAAFSFFFTTGKGLWSFIFKLMQSLQKTWAMLALIIALLGGLWLKIDYNRTHPPPIARPAYLAAPPPNPPVPPLPTQKEDAH